MHIILNVTHPTTLHTNRRGLRGPYTPSCTVWPDRGKIKSNLVGGHPHADQNKITAQSLHFLHLQYYNSPYQPASIASHSSFLRGRGKSDPLNLYPVCPSTAPLQGNTFSFLWWRMRYIWFSLDPGHERPSVFRGLLTPFRPCCRDGKQWHSEHIQSQVVSTFLKSAIARVVTLSISDAASRFASAAASRSTPIRLLMFCCHYSCSVAAQWRHFPPGQPGKPSFFSSPVRDVPPLSQSFNQLAVCIRPYKEFLSQSTRPAGNYTDCITTRITLDTFPSTSLHNITIKHHYAPVHIRHMYQTCCSKPLTAGQLNALQNSQKPCTHCFTGTRWG